MDSVYIRRLELEDAEALLELRLRNRSFFRSYEPSHPESHFTLPAQIQAIQNVIENWQKDLGYGFGIFLQSSQQLIGRVNLSNVVRGAWQNCTIGYYLDRSFNGKGYMTEAVKQAVNFAFHEVDLHRVQAAVMPHNHASIRVLEKAGFRKEGFSRNYLKINGNWEDHFIFAITQEDLRQDGCQG